MKRSLFAFLIISIFCGCGAEQNARTDNIDSIDIPELPAPSGHTSANALDWQGTYTGTLPCVDCDGIETTIRLKQDKTYDLRTQQLGGSHMMHEQSGNFTWDETGQIVTLSGVGTGTNKYFVGENALFQLDLRGNRVTGEHANDYRLVKNPLSFNLTETYWKLIEMNGKPIVHRSKEMFLRLQDNGEMTASAGCNSIGGHYVLQDGSRISFSQVFRTEMACGDMQYEDALLEVFERADNYTIGVNTLSLNKARMAPLARFEAVVGK